MRKLPIGPIGTNMKASKEQLSARLGRRQSNAAGPHRDKRTKRLRTRGDKRRNAIREQEQ